MVSWRRAQFQLGPFRRPTPQTVASGANPPILLRHRNTSPSVNGGRARKIDDQQPVFHDYVRHRTDAAELDYKPRAT